MSYFDPVLIKSVLKETVFWAKYRHPGQTLLGVHLDFNACGTLQADHSAGVYACQHGNSLGWVMKNVNGGGEVLSNETLPSVLLDLDACGTIQTNHIAGVYACQHDTSSGWE
jgi:hypothetical protein